MNRIALAAALAATTCMAIGRFSGSAQADPSFDEAPYAQPAEGKNFYVVGPDGKQMLSIEQNFVPIPNINMGFTSYELELPGSQPADTISPITLRPIDCGAGTCWEIHYAAERRPPLPSVLPQRPAASQTPATWVLGVLREDLYVGEEFTDARSDKTRTLPAGTPVWHRLTEGSIGAVQPSRQLPLLVLQQHPTAADAYVIREFKDGQLTDRVLSVYYRPNEIFDYGKIVRVSYWTRYNLVDLNPAATDYVTFHLKTNIGELARGAIAFPGESAHYNFDVMIKVDKSGGNYLTGFGFHIKNEPIISLSQDQEDFGFIGLTSNLNERIVIGSAEVPKKIFPWGTRGGRPGVVFAFRGAVGGCYSIENMNLPGAGYDNVAGGWRFCQLPYDLQEGREYRLRLWVTTTPNFWGAWIKDMSTGEERQIGALKLEEDNKSLYGEIRPFVAMLQPSACSGLNPFRVTFSGATADNGSVRGTPANGSATVCADVVQASCSASNGCTFSIGH